MKNIRVIALLALCTMSMAPALAQPPTFPLNEPDYHKPSIFSDVPDKLAINLSNMEALLGLPVNAQVNTTIADGFPLVGIVVSKSIPTDAFVKSVIIKSLNRQGAILTFTRVTAANGDIVFIGRMMSKNAGDALKIVKESGKYIIHKQGLYDVMNE